jgi:hypothetical protein
LNFRLSKDLNEILKLFSSKRDYGNKEKYGKILNFVTAWELKYAEPHRA